MDWKPFVILFLLRPAMLADDRPVNAWRMGWEALLVQPTGSLNAFSGALSPGLGVQRISYGTGLKVACQVGIGCELDPAWRVSARCQVSRSMGHTLPTVELGIGRRF